MDREAHMRRALELAAHGWGRVSPNPMVGCVLVREGAKHSWWGNPLNNRRSAVPRHNEINDFLAKKICRDLGIPTP